MSEVVLKHQKGLLNTVICKNKNSMNSLKKIQNKNTKKLLLKQDKKPEKCEESLFAMFKY